MNKKKKSKPKPASEANSNAPDSSKSVPIQEEQPASSEKGGINGYHVNGAINDAESVDSLSEGLETLSIDARELEDPEFATPDTLDRTGSVLENGVSDFEPKSLTTHSIPNAQQSRNAAKSLSRATTGAQVSNLGMENAPLSSTNKRLGSNIEKSVKDLQRCTVSLARYRVVVKEEMDASIKKMKQAFAELQSCLMDREVALLAEMDKVKAEAMEILLSRQKKAEVLKKMTDVAVRMSEEQLIELRADIKHFVSERKYDEDLGRVARFTCDVETLKQSIDSFGQGYTPLSDAGGSGCVSSRGALLSSGFTHWRANCSLGPGGSSGRGRQPRSLANRRREEERRWQERPRGRSRRAGTGDGRPPLLSAPSPEVQTPGRTELCDGRGLGRGGKASTHRGGKLSLVSHLEQSPTLVQHGNRRQKLERMRGARRRAWGSPVRRALCAPGSHPSPWTSLVELSTLGFPQHLPVLFRGQAESVAVGGGSLAARSRVQKRPFRVLLAVRVPQGALTY
ncbi:spermatogenesis associated serine-rich 2 [Cricetulus griseus]